MKKIEEIILKYSSRGMDKLLPALPASYCTDAADYIRSWSRGNVLIATGFCVAGAAETDGPAGALILARALLANGFTPVILTDILCQGYFEPEGIPVEYIPMKAADDYLENVISKYSPSGILSIERCGRNINGDYANMRGDSIKDHTAPIDRLFELVYRTIPSIGIGDGGNEIGMGSVKDEIVERLSLVPCEISTDHLIVATVSNWGGYGLASCLAPLPDYSCVENFLKRTTSMGCIDGITRKSSLTVDGFAYGVEEEIYRLLQQNSIDYIQQYTG